jgi:acylphosphatase
LDIVKLRIMITGPRVHDVGYRSLLLGYAMGLRLPGFDANNLREGKTQVVDVVVEGKESQVDAFKAFVEGNRPASSEVSNRRLDGIERDIRIVKTRLGIR